MAIVLAAIKSATWRVGLGFLLFAIMCRLSFHFTEVVHTPGWAGNPGGRGIQDVLLVKVRSAVKNTAGTEVTKQTEYPAGWLRELALWEDIKEHVPQRQPSRGIVHSAWHSWATRLYRVERIPTDYWYPGGAVADMASQIELRDRLAE